MAEIDADSPESKHPLVKCGLVLLYAAAIFAVPFCAAKHIKHRSGGEERSFVQMMHVPLPPHFIELKSRGTRFDSPDGTIIDATASGTMTEGGVYSFYDDMLKRSGWEQLEPTLYEKDGQRLELRAQKEGPDTLLHLTLTPARN